MKTIITQWQTNIHLGTTNETISTDTISFKCGIFQGDSLSPLLFCLTLNPITNLLKRNDVGYKIEKTKIHSLLYIDDLKVYARNDEEMEKCRALIHMFSEDIRMEFGLDKCATIHIKHGKIENSECVKNIPLLSPNESYKYLGIAQNNTILHNQMKNKTKKEYFQRINAILKSEINAKNTTNAIKTYVMPILRYGFGVM